MNGLFDNYASSVYWLKWILEREIYSGHRDE